jgi:lambda repressor-like predicted transcriptional regulator
VDNDLVARMRAQGHSLRSIAQRAGVGYGTVRMRLAAGERKTPGPQAAATVEM